MVHAEDVVLQRRVIGHTLQQAHALQASHHTCLDCGSSLALIEVRRNCDHLQVPKCSAQLLGEGIVSTRKGPWYGEQSLRV